MAKVVHGELVIQEHTQVFMLLDDKLTMSMPCGKRHAKIIMLEKIRFIMEKTVVTVHKTMIDLIYI